MIKRGGTKDEAKKLAEEFQKTLIEVMFERHEIKDENEIIAAKALPQAPRRRSTRTCPTSLSPTTISVPAAAWS